MPRSERPDILIVRLSSIGDLVHTLPVAVALRRRFPESRIDWLVETRCRDVLVDNPDVDTLVEVDTLGWRGRLASRRTWQEIVASIRHLRKRRYDLVLDLQGTLKSSMFAFLARGHRRIGFGAGHVKERPAALFYHERVSPNGIGAHIIDRHLYLLTALGIESDERSFPIAVPDELERAARRSLKEKGLSGYVALNPGGSWPTKRWSPEKFGELADAIAREWGLPSLVLWGPGEEEMAQRVVASSEGTARLAPETSLRGMMPYIRAARLFVSGDTGPMHLASAARVPVVGIFGPTDAARNGPFGEGDEVVFKSVPCGPCYKKRCPGYDNVCMADIDVSEVLAAVRRSLEAP